MAPTSEVRYDAALTDDGRAEFQALRAEIIERLRAQQQVLHFTFILLSAVVAGASTLPGRVTPEAIGEMVGNTALLPVAVLALLFAGLAALFAEQEVMIAYAGGYIAETLRMPWEHIRHGQLTFSRSPIARAHQWTILGAKYLLAFVPAVVFLGVNGAAAAGALDVAGNAPSTAGWLAWLSAGLSIVALVVLAASLVGVAAAIARYRTIQQPQPRTSADGGQVRPVQLVAVVRPREPVEPARRQQVTSSAVRQPAAARQAPSAGAPGPLRPRQLAGRGRATAPALQTSGCALPRSA